MRTLLTVVMLFGAATFAGAQERLADQLRKGIVQEEVNQNLAKAIEAYQAIVAQFDEGRKTAASALYRLAECSRKAGKGEQALAAYQRVVREFPDQTALVESSRQQLTIALGSAGATVAQRERTPGGVVESQGRERQSLQQEKAALEERLKVFEQRIKAGVVSRDSKEYLKLTQQFDQTRRQLEVTGASQMSSESLEKLRQQLEQMKRQLEAAHASQVSSDLRQRPIGSPEETKLEMQAMEKRLADAQQRFEVGMLAPLDYRQLQTQYQILKQRYEEQLTQREATKNAERDAQLMAQRMVKSVEAEIVLVEDLIKTVEKRIQIGTMSPDSADLLQLKRDLLGLQRKLDELRAGLKR